MEETNMTEVLYETDAELSENIEELLNHGYNVIHEDEINIVATIANGHEYRHLLQATGFDITSERVEDLQHAHHKRAREILTEDEYAQASGSAQIIVIEKPPRRADQ